MLRLPKLSVEIVLNVVQIAISPRALDGLGQNRLIADQMPVGRTGFDDNGGRWRRSFCATGADGYFGRCGASAASPSAARAPAALAASVGLFLLGGLGFLLKRLGHWWCRNGNLRNRRRWR